MRMRIEVTEDTGGMALGAPRRVKGLGDNGGVWSSMGEELPTGWRLSRSMRERERLGCALCVLVHGSCERG